MLQVCACTSLGQDIPYEYKKKMVGNSEAPNTQVGQVTDPIQLEVDSRQISYKI